MAATALVEPAQLLLTLGVSSVRTLVAFGLMPIFSSNTVPAMARTGLAIAVSLPVTWLHLQRPLPLEMAAWPLIAFFAKEAALGVLVGLGFGIFLAGLLIVGEIIDHQTGLTFTQNIDPVHGNAVSLTSQFLERVLFAALMVAGLMHGVVDALYLSYELWPIDAALPSLERVMALGLVTQAGRLFALALLLSGPVVLVLFAVDAAMGLLNRSAPQLSIFHLTLSLKSMVAVGVLVLAFPMMLQRVVEALPEVGGTLQVLLRGMR